MSLIDRHQAGLFAAKAEGATEGEMLIGGMMPVAVITMAAAVALIGVSLITRPPAESTVDKFFVPRPVKDR